MASNPAIASRLQSDALVGRVVELGSLGGTGRFAMRPIHRASPVWERIGGLAPWREARFRAKPQSQQWERHQAVSRVTASSQLFAPGCFASLAERAA